MSEVTAESRVTYKSLLGNRNFRAVWLAEMVSELGDRLHQVALVVLVSTLTAGNLNNVALVWVAIGLPSLLFGLFTGAVADQYNRKRIMITADVVRAILATSIPFLARVDLLWVYVITFCLTTVSLFFRPAQESLLPDIVPAKSLLRANSFDFVTLTVVRLLGFPVAGIIVAGLAGALSPRRGVELAFYLDALTYLVSALTLTQLILPRKVTGSAAGTGARALGGMVTGGLRFVRSHAVLLTNTVLFTLGPLVGAGINTLIFGYAEEATGASGLWFGYTPGFGYAVLEGAAGLGSVAGALVVDRWGERYPKGPVILGGLMCMGLGYLALTLFSNLWLGAGVMAIIGIGNIAAIILSVTLVQRLTPGEFLGRVLSLRGLLVSTAVIMSNAVAGALGEGYGVRPVLALSGGLLILVAVLGFFVPSARNVEGKPSQGEGT